MVHAHLAAPLDPRQREQFDEWLYAPPGGWDAADAHLHALIDAA